ncbi:MAG: hypothetical protein WBW88_04725 [Rhodothermales bacterium]
MSWKTRLVPLSLVSLAVILNVLGAVILKLLARHPGAGVLLTLIGIGAVIGLNGVRFLLWGSIHKRFPLSHTYPMTTLFFPLILVVAEFFGEPVRLQQILATALITMGILVLTVKVDMS